MRRGKDEFANVDRSAPNRLFPTTNATDLAMLALNWQGWVGAPLGSHLESFLARVGLGNLSIPEPGDVASILLRLGSIVRRKSQVRTIFHVLFSYQMIG